MEVALYLVGSSEESHLVLWPFISAATLGMFVPLAVWWHAMAET